MPHDRISNRDASFLQGAIDALSAHIAILDEQAIILFVNRAWNSFAEQNGLISAGCGIGVNYLEICDAVGSTDDSARKAARGIRDILAGDRHEFYLEYTCHSPTQQRWFALRVTRFDEQGSVRAVVAHENITQRKIALAQVREKQQKLERLNEQLQRLNEQLRLQASLDGLTGIPNRGTFDERLLHEWNRCRRSSFPLSLALLDVDFFKRYNDQLGHLAGDECLKAIAAAIESHMRRAGDFAARFGGEEFAVILPTSPRDGAAHVCERIRQAVVELQIRHPQSDAGDVVTVSIGVATVVPAGHLSPVDLLRSADEALYRAKSQGRNRTVQSTTHVGQTHPNE